MELARNDELLLYCLRAVQDKAGDKRLKELSIAGWELLIEDARWHGVAPLLYYRLGTSRPDVPVPTSVLDKLRQDYLRNLARNTLLYQELGKLLGKLKCNNIQTVALKGVHLAIAVYRNIALRPMEDVDLLVKRTDLLKAQEILAEQGYLSSEEKIRGFCLGLGSSQVHLPMYQKKDSLAVELHFHIVGPPFSLQLDIEKLWVGTQTSSLQGIDVLTLCPEDLLLHLCMHVTFHHGFDNGVRPLFDIAQTIAHYAKELDWGQMLDKSRRWGVSKCVHLALSLAEKFAGAALPEHIMKDLGMRNDSLTAMADAEELLLTKSSPVAPNIAMLFDNISLPERVIHFTRCIFPPRNTMADTQLIAGNPLSVYSLYFTRIVTILKRHCKTAWRLFLRDSEVAARAKIENKRKALKDWLIQKN